MCSSSFSPVQFVFCEWTKRNETKFKMKLKLSWQAGMEEEVEKKHILFVYNDKTSLCFHFWQKFIEDASVTH